MKVFEVLADLATNPKHTKWISLLLLAGEAALCALIILRVPYTEIDWSTYMQQVQLFLKGERNYKNLTGDTGPLVYPALHVYLYSAFYYLTDEGTSIQKAQYIFAGLYLLTLAVVFSCYRKVGAPPYLLIPLVLSKRLHSIFLLRLFNDAPATLLFWGSIWLLQRRNWAAGALVWAAGVGIKMTVLLAVPAIGAIVLQGAGQQDAIVCAAFVLQLQLVSAIPFMAFGNARSYLSRAFQLDRQFLYEWTVNWKMMTEDVFLSKKFSIFLLGYHVTAVLFFLNDRWLKPSSNNIIHFFRQYLSGIIPDPREGQIASRVTPMFVMESMLGSMAVGLLCARSLHYQFFAYLGWSSPFILWRMGLRPGMIYFVWMVQEVAWLTYPSSGKSSNVVVACLALQVLGLWFGSKVDSAQIVGDKDGEEVKEDQPSEVEVKPHAE